MGWYQRQPNHRSHHEGQGRSTRWISRSLNGDPAAFGIKLGEEGKLELPIDESSWEEAFQAGEDDMMDSEDTPGFTLVVASAAIGMAMFINASKNEDEESEA